ncbi:insulinase family protein [Streptomyces sp. NBC_01408]|uniref:insulinase family protein n=1 Tax=Streptomyces sp. NBC_01408 TaxID=2903855 RepID=UPI0022561D4E|nr:insulinase family protein [Streptomyces sp. NBC_01408]MCX4692301.1 insulinase family protein [Streptomyces sp. NBC_01408]
MTGRTGIRRLTLANGLRVLIDTTAAGGLTAVAVHYGVGFRSEPEGRAGLAHLLEHMMFEGSERFPDRAYFAGLMADGGSAEGTTHQDYTDYVHVVPTAALERALAAEADRMRAPRFTPDSLAEQLTGVEAEIKAAVYDAPLGGLPWPLLPGLLYDRWANTHDGYGDLPDLARLTPEDCAAFFREHYAPGNAVLTVSGGDDPEQVAALVTRYFAAVPAGPARPDAARRPVLAEPPLTADRVSVRTVPGGGAVCLGYRLPDPAADLDGYLARLVAARLLAVPPVDAGCGFFGPLDALDPDSLVITLPAADEDGVRAALHRVDGALRAIADADEVADAEVRQAARRLADDHLRAHHGPGPRARALGRLEILFGEPALLDELPARLRALAAGRVRAAAGALADDPRAVLALLPGGEPVPFRGLGAPVRSAAPMPAASSDSRGSSVSSASPTSPISSSSPASSASATSPAALGASASSASPTSPISSASTASPAAPAPTAGPGAPNPAPALRSAAPTTPAPALPSAAPAAPAALRLPAFAETGPGPAAGRPGEPAVAAVRDTRAPLVELRLRLPAPPAAAPADRERLALVLADRWTARFPARGAVSTTVESGAVLLDAWLPAPAPDPVLFADLLGAPPTADELAAVEPRARARMGTRVSCPAWLVEQALCRRLLAGRPGPGAGPTALTAPLHAGGIELTAVGDLDPEAWAAAATAALRPLTSALDAPPGAHAPLPAAGEGLALLSLPPALPATAAHLLWATPEPPPAGSFAARWLAVAVLGGGQPGARLAALRTPQAPYGFTSYAGRFGDHAGTGALVQVHAQLPPAGAVEAAAVIRDELRRAGAEPPGGAEVDAARRYCAGQFALAPQTQGSLADALSAWLAAGRRTAELVGFPEALYEAPAAEVARDCAHLFAQPAYAGVLATPAADPAEETP